ncbi:MAG: serine hydrolase domain-containing protein [Pseudomonadales bacterium]|jgi:CubicO group peptidase (beta-lactamase class C family)|nr:serine hydrolase domain-containing protein [Pseudomonadales bacterium]MDP6471461.1 serine hydrolase domain-containing protein [Pseudomonadales bacterium]MDP6828630.1 serine hydrolase domain-containing protein [Pseudomonadales bacterium]MDP6972349.1 serine hydrolase domain-containing protein [Pseudomonadales bacterium]|tara:strand:- start:2501 stop:3721 length:1221 start_codon:yes stop_codon:yes gene_type:complete
MVRTVAVTILAITAWTIAAIVLSLYGVWLRPVAPSGDANSFFEYAVRTIEANNPGNTAFALIEGGAVVAEYYAREQNQVDAHTLFATASFSKWITGLAVMTLVEAQRINLDAPVADYLTRWHLPDSEFDNSKVTVRRLLSHTAGLTDRLGFGDYKAEEQLPILVESLHNPRASRDADVEISVGLEPGSEYLYSGGGYLILQLIVEEVTGSQYADYARQTILRPLGMNRSTFEYPATLSNVSQSFDQSGRPTPLYRYASTAATAFTSSAADMAALASGHTKLLTAETLASMRKPHAFVAGAPIWGLGNILYAPTASGDSLYGHDGSNEPAINSSLRINPDTGDAYVMLISGHPSLASDIGAQWVLWQTGYPDILATPDVMTTAALPAGAGSMIIVALALWYRRRATR